MSQNDWQLDKRLAADTVVIGDLPLSRALLFNDRRYPWVILVPRVAEATELHSLSQEDQLQLCKESVLVSEAIERLFDVQKMNVGALGNIVSQLHVHHVGRTSDDAAWPGPVWGHSAAEKYLDKEAAGVANRFQSELCCDVQIRGSSD